MDFSAADEFSDYNTLIFSIKVFIVSLYCLTIVDAQFVWRKLSGIQAFCHHGRYRRSFLSSVDGSSYRSSQSFVVHCIFAAMPMKLPFNVAAVRCVFVALSVQFLSSTPSMSVVTGWMIPHGSDFRSGSHPVE